MQRGEKGREEGGRSGGKEGGREEERERTEFCNCVASEIPESQVSDALVINLQHK